MLKVFEDARLFSNFVRGLPHFFSATPNLDRCIAMVKEDQGKRRENFLQILKQAVFENQASPYQPLIKSAGATYEDLVDLVNRDGIEYTLEQLFESGVFVTIDEFKGRKPIRRGNLDISVKASDFDSPIVEKHFESSTGGSRGPRTRLILDLKLLEHDSASHGLFLENFKLWGRPFGIWRPLPPGAAGLKKLLMQARLGQPVERWFSQSETRLLHGNARGIVFVKLAIAAANHYLDENYAEPQHTSLSEAAKVAEWLEEKGQIKPALLDTNASSGIRVCSTAADRGYDISGTFFRVGGEPLTAGKREVFESLGCSVFCHYSMAELGHIGMACADRSETDELHLLSHKVALLQRPVETIPSEIQTFYLSSILPSSPKIMINVSPGDCGKVSTRRCNCLFQDVGFSTHFSCVRSFEKLTSEGMNFLSGDLVTLIDEVLPQKFGGVSADYQLVEMEEEGLTMVKLLVSPERKNVNLDRVRREVLRYLSSRAPENRMMVERWKEGGTFQIERGQPYATPASKILTFHKLSSRKD